MRNMVVTRILRWLLFFALFPFFSQTTPSLAKPFLSGDAEFETDNRRVVSATTLSMGYRVDNLSWNIAGNRQGSDPNVLSELDWSSVKSCQLNVVNRTAIKEWIYLKAQLDCGLVFSGDSQDSDYNGDDRTEEYSRSINGVDGNSVWDGSIGIGPRFAFLGSSLFLCPMLGYAISEQDFNIVDGNQVVAEAPLSITPGAIEGLDSRYQTRWHGPWIGMEVLISMPFEKGSLDSLEIEFSGEYHWVDYSADANWNLRSDLQHPVSFSHDADGKGVLLGATLGVRTRKRWGFSVGMQLKEMSTDPGVDRIHHADGRVSATRLNEVRWRAFVFEAGLSYQF